jgi:hypothetical protein
VAAPNDWRNYNLWYTTQRFNFPDQDSVAYDRHRRSPMLRLAELLVTDCRMTTCTHGIPSSS